MTIPTLHTERLILRQPEFMDWQRYKQFMTSENAKYMDGPYSEAEAWSWFCSDVAQWALFGHGALMLEHKVSGECLGQVGINHGPLFPEQELGWLLYPEAEGKGYAYEAAFAFRAWAIESKKQKSLVSYIDPENIRSCRLAERLGAVLDEKAARPEVGDLVYRHSIE